MKTQVLIVGRFALGVGIVTVIVILFILMSHLRFNLEHSLFAQAPTIAEQVRELQRWKEEHARDVPNPGLEMERLRELSRRVERLESQKQGDDLRLKYEVLAVHVTELRRSLRWSNGMQFMMLVWIAGFFIRRWIDNRNGKDKHHA